jgi:sugar phosphate isomerase/epimerase
VNLRLASADFSFPLLPHTDALKLIGMLGFEGVDLGIFQDRSHLQPSHVIGRLPQAASELSHQVEDAGLKIADIFYQASAFPVVAANHPDEGERAKGRILFLRMLEFALRCNAPHMTSLPGVEWDGVPHDTSLKRSAEELAWRAEYATQAGIIYGVEAHFGSVAPTPGEAMKLFNMTPGLTLTVDYTHFTYVGISDDECEVLIPHASHFHARCACKGQLQSLSTRNTIDYPRVLRAMERTGYAGYVGVEYVWQDWENLKEVDNLSETIQLRDLLRAAANGGSA